MKKLIFSVLVILASFVELLNAQTFNAVQFGATADYINTSFVPNFASSQDFSVEFRLKTAAWTGDPSLISDKNWATGNNDGWNIALGSNGSGIDVNVGDGLVRADLLAGTVNDNQWHHVLVTFDRNASLSMYIDGVLVQAVSMSVVANINSGNTVKIAQDGTGNYGSAATCQLADVRIWNKVLPLPEAADWRCRYVDASHPSYADLLHYWKLDEGTGTTAADSKGTSNGTLMGAAVWTTANVLTNGCLQSEIGAGYMLAFDGVNDWVDCSAAGSSKVSAASLGLPTTAMTIETWVNPARYRTWDAMLAFIQDNGSFERGWDLEVRDNNKFAFALATGTTLTYLETTNSFNINQWYHIAAVFDGSTMKIYVNGILENTGTTQTGSINYADSWLSIGMYKDDNESNAFHGLLDEVRLWTIARSETEIRNTMCRKLQGNESGLLGYWRLDESGGNAANDYSGNVLNGVLTNMNSAIAHQVSEAPLGDTSVYLYPSNWTAQTLSLNSSTQGGLSVENITMNPAGMHIYMVQDTPNYSSGIWNRGNTNNYFGVFHTNTATFDALYSYATYADATANETHINLYQRPNNAANVWVIDPATTKNTASDIIRMDGGSGSKEYILADFTPNACLGAANLDADSVGDSWAVLSWSGAGNAYNIEWGPAGYTLGNGTLVTNITSSTYTVTGLTARNNYEFYVQVLCAGNTFSTWVGPFSFSTSDPCPEPSTVQVLSKTCNSAEIGWSSPNSDWVIEWAPAALFQPNLGILTNANSNPFTLTGLIANTNYSFRIKADCDSLASTWTGIYSFRTDSTCVSTNIETVNKEATDLLIYPNPVKDYLYLQTSESELYSLELYDQLGQLIEVYSIKNKYFYMNMTQLPAGFYYLRIQSDKGNLSYRICIE
jgi:hypothetical protein